MTSLFRRDGVSFRYPTNWTLDVQAAEEGEGWDVTIESPATAFVTAALRPGVAAQTLADEALSALLAEYPDLEHAAAADTLAGRAAVGADFDFITVDTAVSGWLRAAECGAGAFVLICQAGEYDAEVNGPVLHAIAASLALP